MDPKENRLRMSENRKLYCT